MRRGLLGAAAIVWASIGTAGVARAEDEPLPPLGAAVGHGDAAEVTSLLDGGADPDMVWDGYTMLTWASGGGKLAVVKVLVEHHATVNPTVSNGFTPLVAAASNHRSEIAAYLIAHGAQVNVQGSSGWTALDLAEGNHDPQTAKVLRAHGGVSGLPPLLAATNRGEAAKVKKMLASGADPNGHDGNGATALSIAANVGSLAIVKALVEHHAAIDAANHRGWTPLMEATTNGHDDVVAYLIEHGAALDVRNADGQTALALAVLDKQPAIAKLLRDHGATDAPPAAAPPTPPPPSDGDCADFRRYADMGATGYASLSAGPAPPGSIEEAVHEKPANVSLGGSECTVSEDDSTLACVWNDGAKDYDALAALARQCSGDSQINSSPGKTMIWYGGDPTKTLIKLFVSGDGKGLVLKLVGSRPR